MSRSDVRPPPPGPVLSCRAIRELDRRAVEEYGLPGIVLMENAGRGAADLLCSLGGAGPIVICCGPGNNGGDGFVMARHLDLRGLPVRLALFADPARLAGDAAINYRVAARAGIPCHELRHAGPGQIAAVLDGAAWIVDALLGTGAQGEPRPPFDGAIDALDAAAAPKLAVDLPSGLDADTGLPAKHAVRAAHTCTFVAAKPGFLVAGAETYTGAVHVVSIGAPRRLVDELLRTEAARRPT